MSSMTKKKQNSLTLKGNKLGYNNGNEQTYNSVAAVQDYDKINKNIDLISISFTRQTKAEL